MKLYDAARCPYCARVRIVLSEKEIAPWVIRARDLLRVQLPGTLESWLDQLAARPSVAAEVAIVKGLR